MIISAYDAWLLSVSINMEMLTMILSIVTGVIAILVIAIPDPDIKQKTKIRWGLIFLVCFVANTLIPKPVVIEKWIIAKYSVPEVMDKFDTYETFYNQLGLELREAYGKLYNERKEVVK